MTDEQTIERLENKVDDLDRDLNAALSRAEEAEALADKYRDALGEIQYSAKEALQ